VPHAGAFFRFARLVVHRDLTLCQKSPELSQDGSQFGVPARVVFAGPKGESATNGHLAAELSDDFTASGDANSVVVRACIYVNGFDLRALVAQALNSSLNPLGERQRGFVALLSDDYPVVRSERVARSPSGRGGS